MRALVYGGPGQIEVLERPDPRPGHGEVLLEVRATGICGSDLHGYTGENGRRFPGQVMGHETVGVVREAAPDAEVSVGDLVTVNPVLSCGQCPGCRAGADHRCGERRVIGVDPTISGAFAELMAVPAGNVHRLGDVRAEHGALVEPLAVGHHAVRTGACTPKDRVLVVGGGPIGQAVALAVRRHGVETLVVSEPSPARRRLLADIGVPTVDPGGAGGLEAVPDLVGGTPTLVVDAVGTSTTTSAALEICVEGGRVVLVGMHSPQVTLPAYALTTAERSLLGSYCYSRTHFSEVVAWVRGADPTVLDRLVEGRVGLDDAPAAFERLASGTDASSKVLVLMAGAAR